MVVQRSVIVCLTSVREEGEFVLVASIVGNLYYNISLLVLGESLDLIKEGKGLFGIQFDKSEMHKKCWVQYYCEI